MTWFTQLVDNGAYALSNVKHGLFINVIVDQQEYAIFEDGEVSVWNIQDRMPMGTYVVNGTYTSYAGKNDLEPVQITNEDVVKEIMSLVKNKKKEG